MLAVHAQPWWPIIDISSQLMADIERLKNPPPPDIMRGSVVSDPEKAFSLARSLKAVLGSVPYLLGPEIGEFVKTGDPTAIKENPGGALVDLLLDIPTGAPLAAGVLIGVNKLRRAVPFLDKAVAPIERFLVPKGRWSDSMYGIEGRHSGELAADTSIYTEPLTKATIELAQKHPQALEFLEPALNLSKKNLERMRTTAWPAAGKGRNLDLILDANGFMSYGRAAEVAALPLEARLHLDKVRRLVDENHADLVARKMVPKDKGVEFLWSYLAKGYEAHLSPKIWPKEALNPANPLYQDAFTWVKTHTKEGGAVLSDAQVDVKLHQILQKAGTISAHPDQLFTLGGFKNPTGRLIPRVDLPPEIEAFLGPLSGMGMARRVGTTLDAQFRLRANDNAFSRMLTETGRDGRPLLIKPGRTPQWNDYAELKADAAFGKWQGASVHPDVADIIPSFSPVVLGGFLREFHNAWRATKTIYNPQTSVNNVLGDFIFAQLDGISPLNLKNTPLFVDSSARVGRFVFNPASLAGDPGLEAAVRLGAVRPGFAASELRSMSARFAQLRPDRTWAESSMALLAETKTAAQVRAFYDMQDQIFRFASFQKHLAAGRTPEWAAIEVNKRWPSYTTTSRAGRFLRGEGPGGGIGMVVGNPFSSFPLESMRIYNLAAQEHPWRLFGASLLPLSINTISLGNAGLTLGDYHEMLHDMPERYRGRAMISVGTSRSDMQWYDASSIIPLGRSWQRGRVASDIAGRPMPQTPLGELVFSGLAWTGFQLLQNRNIDTGEEIWDPDKGQTFLRDGLGYALNNLGPIPPWIGQAANRLPRAIEGVPQRRFSEPSNPGAAALYSLFPGAELKTHEELSMAGQMERRIAAKDLRRGGKSIGRNPTLTERERERRMENLFQRRERAR